MGVVQSAKRYSFLHLRCPCGLARSRWATLRRPFLRTNGHPNCAEFGNLPAAVPDDDRLHRAKGGDDELGNGSDLGARWKPQHPLQQVIFT